MRLHLLSCVFAAATLLCLREVSRLPDGKLHLHLLDVGQGDSIFVVSPNGSTVLVDGGPDLSTLSHLGRLMSFFRKRIDILVLTHTDADHITALPEVLRRYEVGTVLLSGRTHRSGRVDAFLAALEQEGATVVLADPTQDILLGDGTVLDIIWPTPEQVQSDTLSGNNLSVVLRVLYKEHSLLLTGDIETEAESQLLATGADIAATILKVAHHGSRTSSSSGFLLAAAPNTALISVAKNSRFGHPHAEVLHRLQAFGIPIKTTANEGVISMTFE